MPVAVLAMALSGCGTPYATERPIPSEQLGGRFQAQMLTHNGTNNSVILAVRADNDNGHLKVCGLYLYGGLGDDFTRFQKGVVDQNSFIELGTDKDVKGVRLHADFLHGHVTEPGSPLDGFSTRPDPKPSFEKLVLDTKVMTLKADCVTTETPWRADFAQDKFIPNLVITTITRVWIPGHR